MMQPQLQRHPLRGLLWGLVLGLGVSILLTFVWPVIGLDSVRSVAIKWIIVVGAIMFLSMLWGLFGPARGPKGAAQASVTGGGAPAYEQPPPAPDDEPPPAPGDFPPPPLEG